MRRQFLALHLFTTILAPACHGGSAGTTVADAVREPALPLATLVDPAAFGLGRVDVRALANASYFEIAREVVLDIADEADAAAAAGVRLALGCEEVLVSYARGTDGYVRVASLLRGRFGATTIRDLAPTATPDPSRSSPDLEVYVLEDRFAFARIGDHTLAFGSLEAVDGVIARQRARGGGGAPTGVAFRELASAVRFDAMPIAFAAMRPEGDVHFPADDEILAALQQAEGVGIGLDPRRGVHGRVVVRVGNAFAAIGLATLLRSQLRELGDTSSSPEPILATLVRFAEVDRDGNDVALVIDAPEGELRAALERAASARGR